MAHRGGAEHRRSTGGLIAHRTRSQNRDDWPVEPATLKLTIKPTTKKPIQKPTVRVTPRAKPTPTKPKPTKTVEDVYYANCTEVRAAGAAPIRRGHPGYSTKLDRDGDVTACEN